MKRREQVKKAICRQGPDYVPLFIFDGDRSDSDLIQIDLERFYLGPDKNLSEWGFQWDSTDTNIPMGTPVNPPIASWEDFEQYQLTKKPDPFDPARFADVKKIMAEYGPDRYYMGSLYLTGFTIMSFIRQMKSHGFDAVSLWDDWGTQTGLILDPKMWRELFKPRYIRQVEIAYGGGLDVFFHTCGCVVEIIPDLIEIGYDLLNLGQTDINDIEQLGKDFGGKICFVAPISYQTTSLSGTVEDIHNEGRRLIDSLGRQALLTG